MGFNTKYIFRGDSDKVIRDKINYNFNQIMFFGVGPDGHVGSIGATGIFGPAGFKGKKGVTGSAPSIWYRQPNEPTGSKIYDVWINTSTSNGEIYTLGPSGWVFSQFSQFNSTFFEAYVNILGPGSAIDKSTIGFNSTNVNGATASLVLSDRILPSSEINKNASKVVISTIDQTSTPVMTFGKSNSVSSGVPSFYWDSIGSNNNLSLKSDGNVSFRSTLEINIDTDSASTILFGNSASFSCNNSFKIGGTGDFYITSNYSTGSGTPLLINTGNLNLNSDFFTINFPMEIRTSNSNSYVASSIPLNPKLDGGILLNSTNSPNRIFEILDSSGSPYISQAPLGTNGAGNFSQTIIGSTGGVVGGTAGPFSYLVKSTSNYRQNTILLNGVLPYATGQISLANKRINNIFDISQASLWVNDVIVITPLSYTEQSDNGIYIRIPSSNSTSNTPLYEDYLSSTYKIFLNPVDSNFQVKYIKGFVFTIAGLFYYYDFANVTIPVSAGNNCQYVEFTWVSRATQTRQAPRAFWKTCNGYYGQIDFELILQTQPVVVTNPLIINWTTNMNSYNRTPQQNIQGVIVGYGTNPVNQSGFLSNLRINKINSNGTRTNLFFNVLPFGLAPGYIFKSGTYNNQAVTSADKIEVQLIAQNQNSSYTVIYNLRIYNEFGNLLASQDWDSVTYGQPTSQQTITIPGEIYNSNTLIIEALAERYLTLTLGPSLSGNSGFLGG
jgi:hypothetical protein